MPEIEDLTPHTTPLPSSSNEHLPRVVLVPNADRQDGTEDIGLECMRTRKTAMRIACTVLQVPPIRIDTEDVREALSGL